MSIKNRKLQVFVSSTYTDLREERQKAVEAILDAGHIPAGMELFAAGDQSQMEVIKEWIRDSDVYLLILGSRYGSLEPESQKSYTHLEYEYAIEIGKPHFAIVISDEGETQKVDKQGKGVLERDFSEKYNQFKNQVTGTKLVHFWNDLNGIELAIHKSLANFSKRDDLIGWVRGDQSVNSAALAEELARLVKENNELKEELSRFKTDALNDFHGISFKDVFEQFENKNYNVDEVLSSIPSSSPSRTETMEVLRKTFNSIVTANEMLIIFGFLINSRRPLLTDRYKSFFIFLHQVGLINFSESTNSSYKYCEFTETGRRYFNKLRSIDKFKELSQAVLFLQR